MFRSQNHIDELKGVYVPFWLYDSDADAQLRFTATRTRCWSDDDYDYTETSYYSVRRDGVLGFDAVPVDGSSKMADDLMESIEPFAMQDAVAFNTAYLAGYVADKYDVDAKRASSAPTSVSASPPRTPLPRPSPVTTRSRWRTAAFSCTAARQSMPCSQSGC